MMGLSAITGLSFAQPLAGALALAAIPAIVAIHLLQLPSRPRVVSTLFLLDQLGPESEGGKRLHWMRQSIPFWLQILAALIVAWILAEPRWREEGASQKIAVVLDSSASMTAFADRVKRELPERLKRLQSFAAETEWLLLETNSRAPRLYSGNQLEGMLAAIEHWRPELGMHDFDPALQLARSWAGGSGGVIFVTDHEQPAITKADVWAVGSLIENVGFCGIRADAEGWEVMIKNYGSTAQTRSLQIESGTARKEERVMMAPGGTQVIRGRFENGNRVRLDLLSGDEFKLDDHVSLVHPELKPLRYAFTGSGSSHEWFAGIFDKLSGLSPATEGAELRVGSYDPLLPRSLEGERLVYVHHPESSVALLKGAIVAEADPLMEGLSWEGLRVAESFSIPSKPEDRVLLWQGERPLIFTRNGVLVLNFDPKNSNANRLPAFVILLHRSVEDLRRSTPGFERKNFETGQLLDVANAGGRLSISGRALEREGILRADLTPGFFTVSEGETLRLEGGAYFADTREADFRKAASFDGVKRLEIQQLERLSEPDRWAPIWLVLLLTVILGNWAFQERKGRAAA